MARQLGAGRGQGMKSRPALSSMVTGTMAPTPEAVEMTRHPHHEQSKLVEDSLNSSGSSSGTSSRVEAIVQISVLSHTEQEWLIYIVDLYH